jgi:hypothetical protein
MAKSGNPDMGQMLLARFGYGSGHAVETPYLLVLLVFFMNTGGLCDVWEEVQPASNSFQVAANQEAHTTVCV